MDEERVDPTHSFEVAEAKRLGSIEKAILLKEIRRMAVYKARRGKDPWVYYSGSMLAEKFPYMAQRSIERWLKELVEAGELESKVENNVKYDQTKRYTIRQIRESVRQNVASIAEIGEPIPPLSTPLTDKHDASLSAPRFPSSKDGTEAQPPGIPRTPLPKNRFGYDESASADSYEPAIDAETREPVTGTLKASTSMKDLIYWAENRRGSKFVNMGKQLAAITKMKRVGKTPADIKARWVDLEREDFYRDHGLDFMSIANSFDRK